MRKLFKEATECALFGALVLGLMLVVFNVYAAKIGAPTIW